MKSIKPLLSLNRFFAEIGLSYEQGLEEIRRGNIVTVKKARGKNSYIDRSEVVRWRLNRNREALGLTPIQPATTPKELMVLEMCYLYGNPEDEKYYATDYERETLAAKKQEEEANAKEEEVETASQDVEEVDDKQEDEPNEDENNTKEGSEDVDDNESEASDKQDENSDSETEEEAVVDNNEEVDSDSEDKEA